MWVRQTWVFLSGEWAAGSERQPWFTGQACSFTREISRATINTAASFKGAVYHTTGFEGPQTDLVFVIPPPPSPPALPFKCTVSLNTIKCELPPLCFYRLLIDWPNFKTLLATKNFRIVYLYRSLKFRGGFNFFFLAVLLNKRAGKMSETILNKWGFFLSPHLQARQLSS